MYTCESHRLEEYKDLELKASSLLDILGLFLSLSVLDPLYIESNSHTLAAIHNIFHVSQLKKCLRIPCKTISSTDIHLEPNLSYEERPIKILDQKERITRHRTIKFFKIQWINHSEYEATWENEAYLKDKYPTFMNVNQGANYCLYPSLII